MDKLEITYTTASPNIDESANPGETVTDLVVRLACEKAGVIAKSNQNSLIIGADQVACIDEKILGKPGDHETAVRQLKLCSGRQVSFYVGLCVINSATGKIQRELVPYHVHFRKLTDEQIDRYLRKEQPYNCAGSIKSEGLGIALFDRMSGDDPNTLIGLPLIALCRMLENEGVQII